MHRYTCKPRFIIVSFAILAGVLVGCDQFRPTEVKNPDLTDEDFLRTPDAARTWLRGAERQFMLTVNALFPNAEIASDNYFNNYTTNNKVFDIPRIEYHDQDVRTLQYQIHRLREVADFGLDRVLAADPTSTAAIEAELLFFRGMSFLFAGEYFVGLPMQARGEVATGEANLQAAIADFERARSLVSDPELTIGYTLAIARAQYRLGNRPQAVDAAQVVLGAAPTYVRFLEYDGVSGPGNSMQNVLVGASNNWQPLPRLDFLDPKFYDPGPQVTSPIPVLKAEEARLILAEAALATGALEQAKADLGSLLILVGQRPVDEVDSRNQLRGRRGGGSGVIWPNEASVVVAASPGAPFREGLVLTREGDPVPVPVISGTSVDQDWIDSLDNLDDALYVLYLMRQEIFIAEGRRSIDLGIRFPVALAETQTNPNAEDGAWYTEARIPAFIPGDFEMNTFDFDEGAGTVVIHHDLNRYLVENRSSPDILPFHN